MAALLMLLTAVNEEFGACFIGMLPQYAPAFRAAFGVPEEFQPIGAITVGYRVEGITRHGSGITRRRDPSDIIHRGHWGGAG